MVHTRRKCENVLSGTVSDRSYMVGWVFIRSRNAVNNDNHLTDTWYSMCSGCGSNSEHSHTRRSCMSCHRLHNGTVIVKESLACRRCGNSHMVSGSYTSPLPGRRCSLLVHVVCVGVAVAGYGLRIVLRILSKVVVLGSRRGCRQ